MAAAISASLSLTLLTTEFGSAERFNQLCALMGDSIINGIWFYGSDKLDVVISSLDVMPQLVKNLGIGNARYFKALIIQLTHSLKQPLLTPRLAELQISSLRLFSVLAESCPSCLPRWKETIIYGIGMSWVNLQDFGDKRPESADILVEELRNACRSLGRFCPSVIESEYRKLLQSKPGLFDDLLGPLCNSSVTSFS